MQLSIGEKLKILMGRQNMTITQLADKLGQSRQNMSNKMARDNFAEKEVREIADALGVKFKCVFELSDGTEL